jgi:hypothetical protein
MNEPEPSKEVISKISRCLRCLETKLGDRDTIMDTIRSADITLVFEDATKLPELRLLRDLMEHRHLWISRCALEDASYTSEMHASNSICNKELQYPYSHIVSLMREAIKYLVSTNIVCSGAQSRCSIARETRL